MSDDNDTQENPLESIKTRADEMGLDGEERDDYITARMARAGFKRGPGEWISQDDDDDEHDDDDEPMTRGDWRKMQRERRRKAVNSSGAKKVQPKEKESENGKKSKKRDPWWD